MGLMWKALEENFRGKANNSKAKNKYFEDVEAMMETMINRR